MGWLVDKFRSLKVRNWLLIGLTCSFVALAFHMSGFLFPFWGNSNGPISVHYGLWQVCSTEANGECYDIQIAAQDLPDWFMAVQAFAVLGVIFISLAVICAAAKLFLFHKETLFLVVATSAVFFGAFCVFLSVSIFAAKRDNLLGENSTLHFAFGFCVTGLLVAVTAGFVFIMELKKEK